MLREIVDRAVQIVGAVAALDGLDAEARLTQPDLVIDGHGLFAVDSSNRTTLWSPRRRAVSIGSTP